MSRSRSSRKGGRKGALTRAAPPPPPAPAEAPGPPLLALAAALGAILLVSLLLAYRPVYSPDIGFYLEIGRQIAETGSIPHEDTLTFTREGTRVLHYPWLFCLASWWLYSAGGTGALVAARIGLYLLTLGLLLARSWRRSGGPSASALLLTLLFCLGTFWEYRPHLASWVALAAVLLVLEEHERGRSRLLWALPTILALWVNLHSLFVLGLVSIAIHWLAGSWQLRRPDRPLLLAGIASLLACFLTPYLRTVAAFPLLQLGILRGGLVKSELVGTAEFLSPFRTAFYEIGSWTVLWQPILFVHLYALLLLPAALAGWRRYRASDWALLGAFGYLFLQAIKNYGYLVVATLPAAAEGLDTLGGRVRHALAGTGRPALRRWLARALPALVAALALAISAQVLTGYWYASQRSPHRLGGGFNERVLPVRASAFLAETVPGPRRLLNNWEAGGYLGFATGWPVFIDGRNEVMGEEFYREYLKTRAPETLPAVIRDHQIDGALVPFNDLPLWYHLFLQDRDWDLVHRDDRHAVFLREAATVGLSPLGAPRPGEDYPVFGEAEIDSILERGLALRRPSLLSSVLRAHHDPQVELDESLLWLRSGRPEAALGRGLEGLARSTFPLPELLASLGHAFYDRGDAVRAARCFERALRELDDPLARERLEELRRRGRQRSAS
jgi:hypothetical protein